MLRRSQSTEAQEDNTSLDAQAAACTIKAQQIGAEIVAMFREVKSGGLYQTREQLQEAVSWIESKRADVLIAYKLDRTGRNTEALHNLKTRIERAGGQLVFADGIQFQQGPEGDLMFTVNAGFTQYEKGVIRQRTIRGLREMAKSGRQPARAISAYGYHVVSKKDVIRGDYDESEVGTYKIIDEQAAVVRLIYQEYLAGRSLRSLAGWLVDQGIHSPQGGLWKAPAIRSILTHTIYKGEAVYGRRCHRMDEDRLKHNLSIRYSRPANPDDGIIIPAPPLVEPEIWEAANRRLRAGRDERSGRPGRYPLTRLVYCPRCGRRMYAMKNSDRASSDRPHAFGCGGVYPRNLGHAPQCAPKRYSGPLLEQLTVSALTQLAGAPEIVAKAQAIYQHSLSRKYRVQKVGSTKSDLEKEIAALHKREAAAAEQAVEARLDGRSSRSYEDMRHKAEQKRLTLEAQLTAVQDRLAHEELGAPVAFGKQYGQVIAALEHPATEPVERAELFSHLIENIYPIDGTVVGNYNCGGVEIVLKTRRPGPYWVLRHVIVARGVKNMITKTDLTMEVIAEPPHPLPPPDMRGKTRIN